VSRPASKFADGSPGRAVSVREIDGFNSFFPLLCFFYSSRDSRNETTISESVPTGDWMEERKRVSHSLSQQVRNSSVGHVRYVAWPRTVGSLKNPGMKLPVENVFRNFKALNYHDLLKQLLNSYEQLIVQYKCEGSFSS